MLQNLRRFRPHLMFILLFTLVLTTTLVFAQTTPPPAPTPPPIDVLVIGLVNAAVPLLIPFLVYGVRRMVPKIPAIALPMIALGLGVLGNYLASIISGGGSSVYIGALLGAAAVFVREVISTLNEHGFSANNKTVTFSR